MKLKPEHLIPYLFYKLEVKYLNFLTTKYATAYLTGISKGDGIETTYKRKRDGCAGDYIGWEGHNNVTDLEFKPILRPLSDLTNEIEHNGEKFVPANKHNGLTFEMEYVAKGKRAAITPNGTATSYLTIQKLFEWHFDVFGLIELGLAIDINTLK